MDVTLTYRGRVVTPTEVEFIQDLITRHPEASRYVLSKKLCESWGWVQANGVLRDMVCRGLMLKLHRAGHITLPPARRKPAFNPLAERRSPRLVEVERTPVRGGLGQLRPLELRQVRRSEAEGLFNSLIQEHHYLGYTQPVGEHLKYLVYSGCQPVACFAWSSAPRHLGPRDRFIGWSAEARRQNIGYLAYNSRFLILPWVQVPHLASHLLGRMARVVAEDWERHYRHPVYYLETFVDPTRFAGTCYRAANWIYLGQTTGRGKDDQTNRPNRPFKEVLGYPLTRRFRELLGGLE